jgi:hypothetical protein
MPMPETSVDENDFLSFRENQVWIPRKGPIMEPISETHTMNQATYNQLGLCVFMAHSAHALTSLLFTQRIHDSSASQQI